MVFGATVGLRKSEIELVARVVLPKFFMDDLSMDTWMVFSSCKKRVVVTRMPRVMVENFAKEHLRADEVIGTELIVNRFGFLTGLIHETDIDQSNLNLVADLFVDRKPSLGLGRPALMASTTFISLCEEQIYEPVHWNSLDQQLEAQPPKPVIFHGSRLVKRPTPAMALLILLWFPFGIVLAAIRILGALLLPLWAIPYVIGMSGGRVIVKGKPPTGNSDGKLYVCNHRTMIDPVLISYVLGRNIPAVTSNLSRFYNILSPIPIVKFTRIRDVDATKMKQELSKGDLVLCPEGTICFQPFVLRFSALFAEVTDMIVPVAINCRVGFFQNPIRRSWDALDMIILFMNPSVVYEVTFLNQLPIEETCSSGKSPHEVANHVQRILADTLGFQCTNFGRKDESRVVFGNNETSH
ncbi:hypothetical protein AALP_AA1G288500 [Arabis alpina]|uniref:Phospholipid/glycerol acyltransferase domain-containing protein n=1 Tax=Arabis alpina TaxID=50452 RepID=A0A087HRB8_ARAAL|nr:hypothetical protein AALP_AA1G288500 [Arabis alpina]